MTLAYHKDWSELFANAVLWWQGYDQTLTGFPILPSGVTVTPNGTWANDLNLGNNKNLKTFSNSQYITISTSSDFTFGTGNVTIALWVYPTVNAVKAIVSRRSGETNSTISFQIWSYTSDLITAQFVFGNNAYGLFNESDKKFTVNAWNHIVLIRSGNYVLVYKDAVLLGTYSCGASTINDPASAIHIGTDGYFINNTTYQFQGNLKDFIIYKGRALTQPEIAMLMKLTDPVNGYGVMSGVTAAGKLYDKIKVV